MTEVVSKRQVESMCRHPHRKHSPHGQPYTRRERVAVPHVEAKLDGPEVSLVYVYKLTGVTFETRLDSETEEWVTVEELHDLGNASTLPIAEQVAGEWRDGLVGLYPIA